VLNLVAFPNLSPLTNDLWLNWVQNTQKWSGTLAIHSVMCEIVARFGQSSWILWGILHQIAENYITFLRGKAVFKIDSREFNLNSASFVLSLLHFSQIFAGDSSNWVDLDNLLLHWYDFSEN
jgi:hypothetical protein